MSLDGLGGSQQLDDLKDATEDDAAFLQDDDGEDPNSAMEEDENGDYAKSNDDAGSIKDYSQSNLDLAQNFSFLDPSLFDFNTWTTPADAANTSMTRGHLKRKSSMGESSDGSFLDSTTSNNNKHSSEAVASQSEAKSCLTDTMLFARGGGTIARRLAANSGSAASVTNSNAHNSSESGETNRSTTISVTTATSSQQTAATTCTNNHALGSTNTIGAASSRQDMNLAPATANANATVVTDASSAAAVAMASLFAAHQVATSGQQQQQQLPPSSANNNNNNNNNNVFFDPSLLPLALNAIAAAETGNSVAPALYQQPYNTGNQQHQVAAASATMQPPTATAAVPNPPRQAFTPLPQPVTATSPPSVGATTTTNTTQASAQQTANALPPFLLFDAPIELRANFMAAQRALGMPPLQDNNSVHYGLPGSPQQQQQRVRLVDGRHGDLRNKRVKNEREQKRTQKITDLIDHLRVKMEHGGWKVGLKSKFHTLSSCAEYVKHLKQVNKEKEEALDKAKKDLKEKQRKMEEDNRAQQEGPSDPESTTSSLTVSSGSEGRKTATTNMASPELAEESRDSKRKADGGEGNKKPEKKSRLRSHESSDTSSFDDGGGKLPAQQHVNEDRFVNVSDITDSNKDSSSDGNSSSGCQQQRPNTTHKASRSTSPNAAAAARDCPTNRDVHSNVVIEGRKRKASKQATRSKEKNKSLKFELDYEEVFLKSNVPQILATTSGRIVAWNDFFLKATSLTAEEIDRLTIFSLVQPSRLSDLFEIVAAALRYGTLETGDTSEGEGEQDKASSTKVTTESSSNKSDKKSPPNDSRKGNYTAITLPCANFGIRPKPTASDERRDDHFSIKPLYMTVTLMADEDPRKRCFHCVLTDCPGTNGSLGRITPELLSLLFQ